MSKSKFFERTLHSRRIFSGRIISLREDKVVLPNGVVSKREIVEHPGAVAVVAINGRKNIVLIRQFRKAVGRELLEVPAGLVKKGESPASAARRELEEETGFRASKVKALISGFSSPGFCSERIRYYLATGLKRTAQAGDDDEMIEPKILSVPAAVRLVGDGRIIDNKTIIGILLAERAINGKIHR